jgi:hypothetical protein
MRCSALRGINYLARRERLWATKMRSAARSSVDNSVFSFNYFGEPGGVEPATTALRVRRGRPDLRFYAQKTGLLCVCDCTGLHWMSDFRYQTWYQTKPVRNWAKLRVHRNAELRISGSNVLEERSSAYPAWYRRAGKEYWLCRPRLAKRGPGRRGSERMLFRPPLVIRRGLPKEERRGIRLSRQIPLFAN